MRASDHAPPHAPDLFPSAPPTLPTPQRQQQRQRQQRQLRQRRQIPQLELQRLGDRRLLRGRATGLSERSAHPSGRSVRVCCAGGVADEVPAGFAEDAEEVHRQ